MKGSVERKMTNIESALDRKMVNLESKTTELAKTTADRSGSTWFWPFVVLVIVLAGVGAGLYAFYLKMRKMHIL
jgi:hypothetical protein